MSYQLSELTETIVQAWCDPEVSDRVMDVELVKVIDRDVQKRIVDPLKADNKKLREALEFYAEAGGRFWGLVLKTKDNPEFNPGRVARKALQATEGEK